MKLKIVSGILSISLVIAVAFPSISGSRATNQLGLTPIRLAGVIHDPDVGPLAILEFDTGQELFPPGSEVWPNTYLVKVKSNGIIISRNGVYSSLGVGESLTNSQSNKSAIDYVQKLFNVRQVNELDETRFVEQAAQKWYIFGRVFSSMLKNKKRNISEGPYKGAAQLDFDPEWYFKKIGLIRNDIILTLNGHSLADLDVSEIQRLFHDSQTISLSLIRNGKPITLVIDAF